MVDLRTQIRARAEKDEYGMGVLRVVGPQPVNLPEMSAREVLSIANRNNLVNFVQKGSTGKNLPGFYSVIHWFTICILKPFL